jgi:hypothetical protein
MWRRWGSAFIHYTPVTGWDFTFSPDNVLHVGDQHIPLRPEAILGRPWKPAAAPKTEL